MSRRRGGAEAAGGPPFSSRGSDWRQRCGRRRRRRGRGRVPGWLRAPLQPQLTEGRPHRRQPRRRSLGRAPRGQGGRRPGHGGSAAEALRAPLTSRLPGSQGERARRQPERGRDERRRRRRRQRGSFGAGLRLSALPLRPLLCAVRDRRRQRLGAG